MELKQGALFPWHFRLFGILMAMGGLAAIPLSVPLFIILDILGFILITATSGISFDIEKNTYREYQSFLGWKIGKPHLLTPIEKIYINKNTEKSTMYTAHTASAHNSMNTVFDGYLKFITGQKLYLKSSKEKDPLMTELKTLSNYLDTNLIDNTPAK